MAGFAGVGGGPLYFKMGGAKVSEEYLRSRRAELVEAARGDLSQREARSDELPREFVEFCGRPSLPFSCADAGELLTGVRLSL